MSKKAEKRPFNIGDFVYLNSMIHEHSYIWMYMGETDFAIEFYLKLLSKAYLEKEDFVVIDILDASKSDLFSGDSFAICLAFKGDLSRPVASECSQTGRLYVPSKYLSDIKYKEKILRSKDDLNSPILKRSMWT